MLPPHEKGHGPLFKHTWIPFTQGFFVPSLVEIGPVVKISKFRRCIFAIMLSLIGKRAALQNWIPFTQGYFAQHLVKNGQVVLEKKIFKKLY